MISRELEKRETSFHRQLLNNYTKVSKSVLSGLTYSIHDDDVQIMHTQVNLNFHYFHCHAPNKRHRF